jgi:hypothetical protein
VGGFLWNNPNSPEDAFYTLDPNNTSLQVATCPTCLLFNYASQGPSVCQGSGVGYALSDRVLGGYPAYDASHAYDVLADVGTGAPQQLVFAFGDGGCYDNSGTWTLTISTTTNGTCVP